MELYAHVMCIELVRILLVISQVKGWSIAQGNFKGAFLNAYLHIEEQILIKLPNIPQTKFTGQLLKLKKSLYSLRQGPKLWYENLYSPFRNSGLERSSASNFLILLYSSNTIVMTKF